MLKQTNKKQKNKKQKTKKKQRGLNIYIFSFIKRLDYNKIRILIL
jgi:hypothetical protein